MTTLDADPTPPKHVGEWELPQGRRVPLATGGDAFVRELATASGAPAVVLLHGIATTSGLMWFATMTQLAESFRVLAPDLRGHGRSACTGRFRLQDAADDVVAALDGMGIDRAILLGYSLGGTVAQLVAKRHPDRLQGLVLSATAARFGPTGVARLPLSTAALASAALSALPLRRAWFRPLQHEADHAGGGWSWFAAEMRGCHPQTIFEAGLELERFDSRSWLPHLDVATSVIVTKRDRAVPASAQRRLAALIPGAHVTEIDAGHVSPGMAPDVFGPAALEACRQIAA